MFRLKVKVKKETSAITKLRNGSMPYVRKEERI